MKTDSTNGKTRKVMDKIESNRFLSVLFHAAETFMSQDMDIYSGNATLYLLMSMVPLLMLSIGIINRLPFYSAEAVADYITELISALPSVQELIREVIMNVNAESSDILLSVSAISALWSASGGVRSIQNGLDHMDESHAHFIRSTAASLLITVLLIFLFPAMMLFQLMNEPLLSAGIKLLEFMRLDSMASLFTVMMQNSGFITGVLLFLVIIGIYAWLPARRRTIKSQLAGAVLTLLLSAVFTSAFGFFMGTFWKMSSVYGSLAAVFLIAMWTRTTLTILFFGAAVNRSIEERKSIPEQTDQKNTEEEAHE